MPSGRADERGSAYGDRLGRPQVTATAAWLRCTPGEGGACLLLSYRPDTLLIPGTSPVRHLDENMAAAVMELDVSARRAQAEAD
jgi:aryl-alcohol dehydrogenase-like predicted oxidoreductase